MISFSSGNALAKIGSESHVFQPANNTSCGSLTRTRLLRMTATSDSRHVALFDRGLVVGDLAVDDVEHGLRHLTTLEQRLHAGQRGFGVLLAQLLLGQLAH